jgi:hypothetical protein
VAMTAASQGPVTIRTGTVFAEGTMLRDGYSGEAVRVTDGTVQITAPGRVVLLEVAP